MQTETECISGECSDMDRRDEEDGEEMVALNMQIKSALAKVSYYLLLYLLAYISKYLLTMFFLTHPN